jgi:hypothetical protein
MARRHQSGRASAEMHMPHKAVPRQSAGDSPHLAHQRFQVGRNRIGPCGHRCVAAAIPAHRAAERKVQVERKVGAGLDAAQPGVIGTRVDLGGKMRCRRIAGVAGQVAAGIARKRLGFHGLFGRSLAWRLGGVAGRTAAVIDSDHHGWPNASLAGSSCERRDGGLARTRWKSRLHPSARR